MGLVKFLFGLVGKAVKTVVDIVLLPFRLVRLALFIASLLLLAWVALYLLHLVGYV